MNDTKPTRILGRAVSLNVHPPESDAPMRRVESFEAVEGRGIREDARYFERPSRRQVTLIELEQLGEHAATLGLEGIAPGATRANIETIGVTLGALVGRTIAIGGALLRIYAPRTPCHKMDLVAPGLCDLMRDGRQGVLAQVTRTGTIRAGDEITLLPDAA
jgi:hypothetical protein